MPTSKHPAPILGSDELKTGVWAVRALAAIGRIGKASDAAECLGLFHEATTALGAAAGLYCVLIPEGDSELSSISLFACDPAFAMGFEPVTAELHPWMRYARQHTTAIAGEKLRPQYPADAEAMCFAGQHGFRHCLLVPIAASAGLGRTELLCLGADGEASPGVFEVPPMRALAHALAAEIHGWFTRQLQASLLEEARLQPPDLEVLAWEWQGLSTKEIAKRTGLSMAAVDSRFQRLNLRLRCANRRAAARRAAEYGLLQSTWHETGPVCCSRLRPGGAAASASSTGASSLRPP